MTIRTRDVVIIFLWTFACLCLLCFLAVGQSSNAKVPKPKAVLPITTFKFEQLYGGVMIIRATIDNHKDSLNFILDTGSGGISLDSLTANELGLKTVPSGRTIRGIAGVKKVDFAYNHQLNLPGLSIDSLDFHINNYEMLGGVYGLKIDGIIGYSFFSKFIVQVNFDQTLISVFPPGNFMYPSGSYTLKPSISALPMQFAEITENQTLASRYFIDTGAGLCLLLSQQYVKDSAVFKSGKRLYASVAEGIGGKKDMSITIIHRFNLGKYRFKNMPVYVFQDEFNVTSYPFLAGLIGNDLLRRFNMVINYGKSEVNLLPNKSFREPFDYAYSGFNMFQDGMDVIVIDVMPESPAQKAGLKDGDVILGVGNKFAGNLQDYKTILQQPGSRIKLLITRDGILDEIKIVTLNISKKNKIRKRK